MDRPDEIPADGESQAGSLPASPAPPPVAVNPFGAPLAAANPFGAPPLAAPPFGAPSFAAHSFGINSFAANPPAANPFAANPFAANPFAANPLAAGFPGAGSQEEDAEGEASDVDMAEHEEDDGDDEVEREKLALMLPTGSSNFAPKPLMTFMVYKPEMQCEICWTTGLELPEDPSLGGESDPEVDNATPELLPCGHVFCHECITRWYEGKNYFCPSCKAELVYGCDRDHSIPPIPLAQSTIGGIPKTLPEGGEIPARCTDCEESVIKDRQAVILRELRGRIAELQHQFREGDEDAERQLADFYRHQEVLREDQQELNFRKFTYSSW